MNSNIFVNEPKLDHLYATISAINHAEQSLYNEQDKLFKTRLSVYSINPGNIRVILDNICKKEAFISNQINILRDERNNAFKAINYITGRPLVGASRL